MITINLTPRQLQMLNSAMSVYYSTRSDNNPLKSEVLEFKNAMLVITKEHNVKPAYIECNEAQS